MNRIALFAIAFVALLATPLLLRWRNSQVTTQVSAIASAADSTNRAIPEVVILTPSNEQMRIEFAHAFCAWHEKTYGQPARVVWSTARFVFAFPLAVPFREPPAGKPRPLAVAR